MTKKIKTTTLTRINYQPTAEGKEIASKPQKYSYSEYDPEGQLIQEMRYNEEGEVEDKKVNTYDESGWLVEEISYLGEEDMAEHMAYERDAAGKVTKAFKIYQDGERDTIHYNRDEAGNLIEKITIDSYNEEEAREIIDYENNKIMLRKRYEYDELLLEESFSYDPDGNMKTHTKWSAEDENARYESTFDSQGRIMGIQKLTLKGKQLSQVTYHYEKEQLTAIVEKDAQGENTTNIVYDGQGNAIEQTEVNKQGGINNRAVRTYNENKDVVSSEVWIDFHGRALNQHYILTYEYTYFD